MKVELKYQNYLGSWESSSRNSMCPQSVQALPWAAEAVHSGANTDDDDDEEIVMVWSFRERLEHEDQTITRGKMSDSGAPEIQVLQEKSQKSIYGDEQAPWRHQTGSLPEVCLESPSCLYSILRQPHE